MKTLSRRLEDVLARRLEYVLKTSWRRLKDVFPRCLEKVLKTSWRRREDILKTSWRHLQDVFWRRMINKNIFILMRTSWRRLKDVFGRRRRNRFSRRFQDVFIKTNVCWVLPNVLLYEYRDVGMAKAVAVKTSAYRPTCSNNICNYFNKTNTTIFVIRNVYCQNDMKRHSHNTSWNAFTGWRICSIFIEIFIHTLKFVKVNFLYCSSKFSMIIFIWMFYSCVIHLKKNHVFFRISAVMRIYKWQINCHPFWDLNLMLECFPAFFQCLCT